MSWLLLIIATVFALLLLRRQLRLRRLMRELEAAARVNRRLMPRESQRALKSLGVDGLVRELNAAIDLRHRDEAQNAGYSKQVEAMLRAVQEVVIVFSPERKIEFANRAAERLFRQGQSLHGLRLESIMRSLSLLELLNAPEELEGAEPRQIQLEHDNKTLWFEASCARVRSHDGAGGDPRAQGFPAPAPRPHSTLLVLHEITQLKHLEEMRRDFVANVSHELRTPLTIIKGFAETLVEDEATITPKSRIRFLEKIVSNAERLNVLVEDLLTLSRLESKPDQLDLVLQSLRVLLEDCIENYRTRIDPQTQSIALEFDPQVGDFAFDRYRLTQVFDNLTENVFRYAPEFTRMVIRIELDPEAGLVVGSVSDDGPGIPDKDLPHIFGRFYRVDKGRSRERGGTGLGLSIVKHIIQLHGGSVHAENVAADPQNNPPQAASANNSHNTPESANEISRHTTPESQNTNSGHTTPESRNPNSGHATPESRRANSGHATPESRRAKAGARIVFTLPYNTSAPEAGGRTSP